MDGQPSIFCAASETARDVGDNMADKPLGSLPQHPLEEWMECTEEIVQPPEWTPSEQYLRLMEVYVNDFIQLAQTTDPNQLRHLSRAILHGVHLVFPPPSVTGHVGKDPVSMKKLAQGDGRWATRKEILGWIFDGVNRTIELPPDKVEKITNEIKK
jgi:hypothetical protein